MLTHMHYRPLLSACGLMCCWICISRERAKSTGHCPRLEWTRADHTAGHNVSFCLFAHCPVVSFKSCLRFAVLSLSCILIHIFMIVHLALSPSTHALTINVFIHLLFTILIYPDLCVMVTAAAAFLPADAFNKLAINSHLYLSLSEPICSVAN